MKTSIAFPILGLLAALSTSAMAQPQGAPQEDMAPVQGNQPETVKLNITQWKGGLRLKMKLENAPVVAALTEIAAVGSFDLWSPAPITGQLTLITLQDMSPEEALELVCAKADLTCKKENGSWIITKIVATPPKEKVLDLSFSDVTQMVEIIALTFQIDAKVAPGVQQKIGLVNFRHISPRQALEKIATLSGLELQEKDGKFLLVKPTPVE